MEQQTTPDAGVSNEAAIEGKLLEAFGGIPAPDADAEPEAAEAPEQVEESQANDDGLTAEDLPEEPAPQPSDGEFELVHNGKHLKMPKDEVIKLAQQGFDYTTKTQELASDRKKVADLIARAQEVEQMAPMLAAEHAVVAAYGQQLQQWQNVDWVQLATNDPLEYPKHRAQYEKLLEGYNAATRQFQAKAEAVKAKREEVTSQLREQEMQKLRQYLPGIDDPKKFGEISSFLVEWGGKDGYSEAEIRSISDARMIRTLWKASQYDKLVQSKAEKSKQLRSAPPVLKPGSPTSRGEQARTDFRESRDQLRKAAKSNNTAAQEHLVTKMLERTFAKR